MKNTAQTWDAARAAFASSLMVDTPLSSLAQNLDGPDWPIRSKAETPATYIDLSFAELTELLALKGQPPERADLLIGLLQDTLAFDSPFGEMVEQNAAAAARDNQLLKNIFRLGIPEDFPVALTALGDEAREFCRAEQLLTLGAFAVFAQKMSQAVIVGGDFRKLLNALSHIDEAAIAEVLPFRPGAKGLHLVEALAQATRTEDPPAHAAQALAWFTNEMAMIRADVAAGGTLPRHFAVLGKPALETAAAALLQPHLRLAGGRARADGERGGWFGSLVRLFKT